MDSNSYYIFNIYFIPPLNTLLYPDWSQILLHKSLAQNFPLPLGDFVSLRCPCLTFIKSNSLPWRNDPHKSFASPIDQNLTGQSSVEGNPVTVFKCHLPRARAHQMVINSLKIMALLISQAPASPSFPASCPWPAARGLGNGRPAHCSLLCNQRLLSSVTPCQWLAFCRSGEPNQVGGSTKIPQASFGVLSAIWLLLVCH